MKTLFEKLYNDQTLSKQEAYELIVNIKEEKFNSTQLVAIMTFFNNRSVCVNELIGFKEALLDLSVNVKLDKEAMDVCGTGGDGKNTFNISTLSAFVLAASGIPVAKHGNHGSTSISGSSDILKYFGYDFKTTSQELNQELEKFNLCFIHAPLFHPTLKLVAKQRKELGVRTFFNLLGPLVNPARVKYKYIGVYNLEVARLYNYVLQDQDSKYCLVHSLDGYDEVSLTSAFKCIGNSSERTFEPFDLGYEYLKQEQISSGSTIKYAAEIFVNVLSNKATEEQKKVVIVNSALAMNCYDSQRSITDCIQHCKETIESKKAFHLFNQIINQN